MPRKSAKKATAKEVTKEEVLKQEPVETKEVQQIEKEDIPVQNMDTDTEQVQNTIENEHLFSIDVSNYGIKKDEAEKLVNTAIKFYFDNKDKVFVNSEEDLIDKKEENNLLDIIAEYEKSLKLFNYVPKPKVISFLKTLKENL